MIYMYMYWQYSGVSEAIEPLSLMDITNQHHVPISGCPKRPAIHVEPKWRIQQQMANLASVYTGSPCLPSIVVNTQELAVIVSSYRRANYSQLSQQLGLVIALQNQNVDFFGKRRNVHKGGPFAPKHCRSCRSISMCTKACSLLQRKVTKQL